MTPSRKHPGGIQRRHFAAGLGLAGLAASGFVLAADFPNKPIKVIVPWAAGGGGDVVVRLLATSLSERLGQPVIVDNRGGATGTIGSAVAAKSPADGYTLVYGSADSHSIVPHLYKQMPYDARKDFTAIAPIGFLPYALAVHPSMKVNTLAEFVQAAKKPGDKLTYGSWGVGSSGQVLMEGFKSQAGINLLHVPYQGTGPLMMGLVSGQIQSAILPMPLVEQHARSNAIRLLGVTAKERMAGMAEVPTMKEQGFGMDAGVWIGFMGPVGMPADVLTKIHDTIQAAVSDPRMNESLKKLFIQPEVARQGDYQAFINSEYDRWGGIIRTAKITLD